MLDGELEKSEMESVLHELSCSDLYKTVDIYFQIGDVLREGNLFQMPSCNISHIVRQRLKSETYLSIDLNDPDHADIKGQLIMDV